MEEKINSFLRTTFIKRLILYSFIAVLLYELRGFLNLFLLIFFVTYIMNELCKFFHFQLSRVFKVSEHVIIVVTYSLLTILLVSVLMRCTPIVLGEAKSIAKSFDPSESINSNINKSFSDLLTSIHPYLNEIFVEYNFNPTQKLTQFSGSITTFLYKTIKSIGTWMLNIFLMVILSLFFLMEKNKMKNFVDVFRESKISFVYNELKPSLLRFYRIFGMMIKTQLIISAINSTITIIALFFLGFQNLFALSIMVFVLGLIPVMGVFLSTIPLIFIGFKLGGIAYVIYILVLIVITHTLEAYVLFPRISANFTKLPLFVTILVLLVSEHTLGPWGLIFGLPLFVFFIESLKVTPKDKAD